MVEMLAAVFRMVGKIWDTRYRNACFRASVVVIAGDTATVQRINSTVVEGPYQCAYGLAATLSAGNQVKVQDVTGDGGYVVEYRIP